jgi:glycosyltransferase involved in cell wall biosynthesis
MHGREFDASVRRDAEKVAEVVTIQSMVHPISPARDVRAVVEISRRLKALAADVVHTHQSKAGVLGRVAARLARTPCVIHGVHILPFVNVGRSQEIIYVTAERLCARFTDAFISVSPSVRDACIAQGIGARRQHFVAHSPMDVARFKAPSPPADWRQLLNVPEAVPRPPTAVMLAAFEPRKRQVELIRAIPEAFSGIPDWRLLFAGEGETQAQARELVRALGLADRIRFAGYRRDPEAIIALADVCLLTSMREGLPRVLVQYVAAGRPCVVSRLPGLEDVVRDGVSAVITESGDVPAAARAAARLLANPLERARLAAGASDVDVDAWSPDVVSARVTEAYAAAAHADSASRYAPL